MKPANKKEILFIIGLPGAGKDFASRLIQKELEEQGKKCIRCCVGDELRRLQAVKPSGHLSDLNVVQDVIRSFLEQEAHTYVFDGFPRSVEQLESLAAIIQQPKMRAIILDCPTHIAKARLQKRFNCPKCLEAICADFCKKCQTEGLRRSDDLNDATIAQRIAVYLDFMPRIVEILQERGVSTHRIDAETSIEKVASQILALLK